MPAYSIHPTVRLALWVVIVVCVQVLSGSALLLAFIVLSVIGQRALKRGLRLVWRARWLLLSLLIVFSWGVAGTPLWSFGFFPTEEGVAEGMTHLGRLLLVLMAVATFLEQMSVADLLAATHLLLKPFRRFGLDADRGVVRLMLVLRAVETMPRPRDWRVLIEATNPGAEECLEVSIRPLGRIDCAIALAVLIAVSCCVFLV
ncbi:MAG: hypothetical protein QM739_14995 [Propionivibrio sp.]